MLFNKSTLPARSLRFLAKVSIHLSTHLLMSNHDSKSTPIIIIIINVHLETLYIVQLYHSVYKK